ncbi:hypothetical protein GOZ90_00605 [Agrobacterium vitis]|uniref:Uncharacterized protein n=1 Tax=Agrobacterium vitis TaxID=373 RepID=A0A6L6VCD4_AGRVI|nr:hypothetical protein [Agrobacterium vitis]MUZ71162.1 hypothetical protein [Agrobacterium vitis]
MLTVEPKDILHEVEDLLRTIPDLEFGWYDENALDWLGRTRAILDLPQLNMSIESKLAIQKASSSMARESWQGKTSLRILLNQVRHTIRMQTVGPLSVAVDKGMIFDYFDALKKILQEARTDVFVVDPYLDSDFVARYFPFVAASAKIRLLVSKHINELLPTVSLYCQQHQKQADVRKANNLHDRYVFIDGRRGFQSGASFHQGGVKSPTTLTEINDTFIAVKDIYENEWSANAAQTK